MILMLMKNNRRVKDSVLFEIQSIDAIVKTPRVISMKDIYTLAVVNQMNSAETKDVTLEYDM